MVKGSLARVPSTRRLRNVGSHVWALSAVVGVEGTEVDLTPRRQHRRHQGYKAAVFKFVRPTFVNAIIIVWGYFEGCVSLVAFITGPVL